MKKIAPEVRQAIREIKSQEFHLTYQQIACRLNVTCNAVLETLQVKRTKSLEDRFWSFVDKSNGPDACWEWAGSRTAYNYGQLYVNEFKRPVAASRISLYLKNGKWPIEACHRCDNPPCVNPGHLFDGTRKDNMQDCSRKGRCSVPKLRGYDKPGAKLTSDDVWQIKTLRHLCTDKDLAAAFGVSRSHVGNICSGRDRKYD